MASITDLLARVRTELGDFGQPFNDSFTGTAQATSYDLTQTEIVNATIQAVSSGGLVNLVSGSDFALDPVGGRIYLFGQYSPLAIGTTLIVNGTTSGMFTDDELTDYINDAWLTHSSGRTVNRRMRTAEGFTEMIDIPMQLEDLPPIEDQLVGYLTVIECLWALTTDASTDIDIATGDGTHIARSQRFSQMRYQIDVLTDKYNELCAALNVGIHRIEVSNLRRVSRTTGRFVPVYKEREFDDYTLPQRMLPHIDSRDDDESGLPSPAWGGYW